MSRPRILVVGSCCMDYTFGSTVVPREGETVLGNSFSFAPGGKGANQALQAALLGAEVTFVGKFGRDMNAEALIKNLRDAGIDVSNVLHNENVPTAVACIQLQLQPNGEVNNRIIVIPGAQMTFTTEDIAFLQETIRNYDLVLLQLEINMEINELVAAYAHAAGVPVMLNSAPSAPLSEQLLSKLTYISPNEHEARDLTGIEINSIADAKLAAEKLRSQGVPNVLITLGAAGAVYSGGNTFLHKPCVRTKVVDPTAAGDSFIGAFSTAIAGGLPVADAMVFANHVASITVSGRGAQSSLPSRETVEAAYGTVSGLFSAMGL